MALTFEEKTSIIYSYSKLRKVTISLERINYYHDYTKNRRKTVANYRDVPQNAIYFNTAKLRSVLRMLR